MSAKRAITEIPNVITTELDMASPPEMMRLFRQTDSQIFTGYDTYAGMLDDVIIDKLTVLSERCAKTLTAKNGCVVMGGAGTSGRLSMFVTRACNHLMNSDVPNERAKFRYLMAGGDVALIRAFEGAEDDAALGARELKQITEGCDDVFYVGITCGMSAPYVAGQLEAVANGIVPGHGVLLAFNPTELARRLKVDGWNMTFGDVVDHISDCDNMTIVNPILGPEPVTGSTRMKSGTGTRIVLETIYRPAIALAQGRIAAVDLRATVVKILLAYRDTLADFYLANMKIAELVAMGGDALRGNGHIYYLGTGGVDAAGRPDEKISDAGIIGLIDASECPPTYGASFDDVRGFLLGGWRAMFPFDDKDLTDNGKYYHISFEEFAEEIAPTLSTNDLCVFLDDCAEQRALMAQAKARGAKIAQVTFDGVAAASPDADLKIMLSAGRDELCGMSLVGLQIKLLANALTTGAFVLKGKVYGNRMIDLKISNNKLFHRTVGIVVDLMHVGEDAATDAVLRAVFETDTLTAAEKETTISDIIDRSQQVSKVVPKALLIASGRFDYAGAAKALDENPMVRAVLASVSK